LQNLDAGEQTARAKEELLGGHGESRTEKSPRGRALQEDTQGGGIRDYIKSKIKWKRRKRRMRPKRPRLFYSHKGAWVIQRRLIGAARGKV